jgi:hypothetical protein
MFKFGFGEAKKIEAPASEEKTEKKEPEFEFGQKVIVERSNGRLEKGWEVDAIGPRIRVINKIQKKSKWVSPENLQTWNEIGFATDEPVMVKRSNGEIEPGWKVNDFGQGIIEVIKLEGKKKIRKFVTPKELKDWNDPDKIFTGHRVWYKDQATGLPQPGWTVTKINEETGEYTIYNKTMKKQLTVKANEIYRDLSAQKERYRKIKALG